MKKGEKFKKIKRGRVLKEGRRGGLEGKKKSILPKRRDKESKYQFGLEKSPA